MNAADQAIEEIREVRRRISAEFDHDIAKYAAHLREMEKGYPVQVQRGKELLAKRAAEREKYPEHPAEKMFLNDKPQP